MFLRPIVFLFVTVFLQSTLSNAETNDLNVKLMEKEAQISALLKKSSESEEQLQQARLKITTLTEAKQLLETQLQKKQEMCASEFQSMRTIHAGTISKLTSLLDEMNQQLVMMNNNTEQMEIDNDNTLTSLVAETSTEPTIIGTTQCTSLQNQTPVEENDELAKICDEIYKYKCSVPCCDVVDAKVMKNANYLLAVPLYHGLIENLTQCLDNDNLYLKELITEKSQMERVLKEREFSFLNASKYGDINAVKELLKIGVNIEAIDQYKLTPLMLASRGGHTEIVKLLLEAGADVNKQPNKDTALHLAVSNNRVEICKLLLDYTGANPNIRGTENYTPLHSAALFGRVQIANLLLDKGADINARGAGDRTPLLMTPYHDQVEVVRLLVSRGANVDLMDNEQNTVLILAIKLGKTDIIDFFKSPSTDI